MGILKAVIVSPFASNGGETGVTGADSSWGGTAQPCRDAWQMWRLGQGGGGSFSLPKPLAELTSDRADLEFMSAGVIGQSCSFPRACASPAVSRRRFSKELSIAIEIGKCENEKLFCKGQPEQGAGLTFMSFRSSSELLLCYT